MSDVLTIKVISDACGILPQTLRAWEKRYQAFVPKRGDSGHRVYGQRDLKKAMALSFLLKKGFSISQIAHKSNHELYQLLENTQSIVDSTSSPKDIVDYSAVLESLMLKVSCYQFDEFNNELNRQRTLLSVKEFIFELCIPIIRLVGDAVMEGKFSVSQEHIVSTLIRGNFSELKSPIDTFVRSRSSLHRYALATPEGNHHELPIIIADLICGINGCVTQYLGAGHPADSLGQAIDALKCDRLILGTIHSENWPYDKEVIPYLQNLDQNLQHPVEIVIGGAWKLEFPKFKWIKEVHFLESFKELDRKLANGLF